MMAVLGALLLGIWIGAKIEEKYGHPKEVDKVLPEERPKDSDDSEKAGGTWDRIL